MTNLAPIETAYLLVAEAAVYLLLARYFRAEPALARDRGLPAVAAVLTAECAVTLYAAWASGLLASPTLENVVWGWWSLPYLGGFYFSNALEGVGLTVFSILVGRRGALWTAGFVIPLWVGFHDGAWFLVKDLGGGVVPLSSWLSQTYSLAYFGYAAVGVWQVLSVLVVLRRAASQTPAWRRAAALTCGVFVAGLLQDGAVYDPVLGDAPFMVLYSAFIYMAVSPRREYIGRQRSRDHAV